MYQTINPNKMDQNELRQMCSDLTLAKNRGEYEVTIITEDSTVHKVSVGRKQEYEEAFKTHTGQTRVV